MGYAEMSDCWDVIAGDSVGAVRDAMLEHHAAFELDGEPGEALFRDSGDAQVLIIVAIDAAGALALALVPATAIDEPLAQALRTIDGRTFAGAADLDDEQWDAAVLVMAALALEMRDADDLARWAADEGSSLTADDVRAVWNRWSGTSVDRWSQLDRAVSHIYSFRRAM